MPKSTLAPAMWLAPRPTFAPSVGNPMPHSLYREPPPRDCIRGQERPPITNFPMLATGKLPRAQTAVDRDFADSYDPPRLG